MAPSRRAAALAGVPYTTARGWVRRFGARSPELGVAFAALGGEPVRTPPGPRGFALVAIGAAFGAAAALPGWAAATIGGSLLAVIVCKTVGSAFDGSNPSPATTTQNSP